VTANAVPYAVQALSHPADNFRRAQSFANLGQQGVRSWVVGDMLVTANGTPNMSVNVAAGQCLINGTQNSTSQGSYHGLNDASVNLAIAASDATNPRIDIVVAQVRDAAYSGANNDFILAVVTGTPAGSPAAPATPANAIVLAQIAVAANATTIVSGNITDKRPIVGVPFKAYGYAANNQSLTAGTPVLINVNAIDYDPNGNFNTTTHLYTCPVPGTYWVAGGLESDTNTTLMASIRQAGSRSQTYFGGTTLNAAGNRPISIVTALIKAAASDTFGLWEEVTTVSGNVGDVNTLGKNFISVQWTGP